MDDPPSPAPVLPTPEPTESPEEPELTPDEERQQRVDYLKNVVPPRKPKAKWPRYAAIAVVLIIVIAAAGFGLSKHKAAAPPAKKTTAATVVPSSTGTSAALTNYVSNGKDLNLSFSYPSNWSVTPVSNGNPNDQTITLTSPLVSLTSAASQSVTGKVVLSIRPGTDTLSELDKGSPTVAQNSVQFAYSKPTASQHQYPYLTFVHFSVTGALSGSFQEVIVSGINQMAAGTALSSGAISVDPIISASFYDCASTACTGTSATPLAITNSTWTNATIFQQTLAILESLQLN